MGEREPTRKPRPPVAEEEPKRSEFAVFVSIVLLAVVAVSFFVYLPLQCNTEIRCAEVCTSSSGYTAHIGSCECRP